MSKRRTKFKVGDLVIHSGSLSHPWADPGKEMGIVMECSSSQIDFGRFRSVLVHWFDKQEKSWAAPRSLFLADDVIVVK